MANIMKSFNINTIQSKKYDVGRTWSSMLPYAQLMRLDRPLAAIYFYMPLLLGSLSTAKLNGVPLHDLLMANGVLVLWTFFFRGCTNAWNDILDVNFDRQVQRTKNRPLARGALSVSQAIAFDAVLACCCLMVLPLFPRSAQVCATTWLVAAMGYPLSKRVTNFPQLVFGLIMSFGIVLGATATYQHTVPKSNMQRLVTASQTPLVFKEPDYAIQNQSTGSDVTPQDAPLNELINYSHLACLYGAHVAWSIYYETIYSYQDVKDDKKAGVKNVALHLPHYGKYFLAVLAVATVVMLYFTGKELSAGAYFYVFDVAFVALILAIQLFQVDLSSPASCGWWFRTGGFIIGASMVSGLVLDM